MMRNAREDMARRGMSREDWKEYSRHLSDSIFERRAETARATLAGLFATKLAHISVNGDQLAQLSRCQHTIPLLKKLRLNFFPQGDAARLRGNPEAEPDHNMGFFRGE